MTKCSKICATEARFLTNRSKLLGPTRVVQCACQSKSTILYKIMAKILIGLIKQVNIFHQPSLFNDNTKNIAPNRPMFDRFTQILKQPSLL